MKINRDLIFNQLEFENQEELFDFASNILEKQEIVRPSFNQAIKSREKEYPTGIEVNDLNIALCHTDSEHVIVNNMMVLKLKKPVAFQSMATLEDINVSLVFVLLLNDPKLHLEVLQSLSLILQDTNYLKQLNNARTEEEIYDLLTNKISIS